MKNLIEKSELKTVGDIRRAVHALEKRAEALFKARDAALWEMERGRPWVAQPWDLEAEAERLTAAGCAVYVEMHALEALLPENREPENRGEEWWQRIQAAARAAEAEVLANMRSADAPKPKLVAVPLEEGELSPYYRQKTATMKFFRVVTKHLGGKLKTRYRKNLYEDSMRSQLVKANGALEVVECEEITREEYEAAIAGRRQGGWNNNMAMLKA